jgi:hypothetical protein
MSGLTTLLATRVESLLPRADAAACVPPSPWCEQKSHVANRHEIYSHRECHFSCHGKSECGIWLSGMC